MWPEASRLVRFCCSHQVAHFLSSSVISVISCPLSMSPCVSAVVSVHCNIIKWWHKLCFFPFFFSQDSGKNLVLHRRDLIVRTCLPGGCFGTPWKQHLWTHNRKCWSWGLVFVSAAANIPAHLRMLWREKPQETGQEERQQRGLLLRVRCRFLTMLSLLRLEVGSAGPGWRRRWSYSLLPPVRQTRIQSSTSRDVAYCSRNPPGEHPSSHQEHVQIVPGAHAQAQGGYSTPDTCDLGITAMIAPCGRIRGSGELTHVVVETESFFFSFFLTATSRPNSTVKTAPSDLICYSVSVGLLLTSFHSACN